jgi:catechol 2,3-dioxygenase-like lactoylglutathione lyase family enzyme
MSAGIVNFDHVNVTVPRALEQAAKDFYSVKLGLEEVPKPEASRGRGGAWYQLGGVQLHYHSQIVSTKSRVPGMSASWLRIFIERRNTWRPRQSRSYPIRGPFLVLNAFMSVIPVGI